MISGIVLFTFFMIRIITNAPIGTSTSGSSKTVVVDNRPHRYYYGFNEPVHRYYNPYKAQYYN
jgi:ABC-type dipeptide/oligopeptide/nickel transport system permease component